MDSPSSYVRPGSLPERFLPLLPVLAATVAVWFIVPDWPFRHLGDPSHWGVIGFGIMVVLVCKHTARASAAQAGVQRLLRVFLVAMPVVYLADWLRFGDSPKWLAVEAIGAAGFWAAAGMSVRRSPWWLPVGIVGHAVWDAAHYQLQTFVPDWYIIGCVVADVGVGIFAAWIARPPSARAIDEGMPFGSSE